MTADQAAAVFFMRNLGESSCYTTSDGNAFPLSALNLAKHHAASNGLAAPATKTRAALTAAIATAELENIRASALTAAHAAVEAYNDAAVEAARAAVSEARQDYADALADLADELQADDLENLPETFETGAISITRDEAVVATVHTLGIAKADWLAMTVNAREAEVTEMFGDLIE